MIKKLRKAFTIMELVIVIAIIAILAAVLILTFSNILRKSQVSSDTQLIRNLNIALEMDKASGNKHETMHSALLCAKEAGYDVSKINAQATDNEILWDSVNDVFCYLNDNEIEYIPDTKIDKESIKIYEYWRIYKEIPETQTYSIYWNNEKKINENTTFTVGFDAGYNEEKFDVNYVGASVAQKITIRTNGQNLSIGDTNDHIKHYGLVRDLSVEKVDNTDCYCEYGYVGKFKLFNQGKYIANKAIYHQTEEEINTVLREKTKTLTQVKYGEHYYGEDGKCIICGSDKNHKHNISTWLKVNNDYHEGTCETCKTIVKEEHTFKNGKCTKCEYEEVKNGLFKGFYYKEGELYTGPENDGLYEFVNGRLVVDYVVAKDGDNVDYIYSYSIPTDDNYVTIEIILRTEGEDGLNTTFSEATFNPGDAVLNQIKILDSNDENKYNIKSIKTSYEQKLEDAITYLANSIKASKDKNEILSELNEKYGIDESCYPVMTESNDFKEYLLMLGINSTNLSEEQYNNIKNATTTFSSYLKNKHNITSILNLPWLEKVNYYDGFNNWPSSNIENKIGIFNGTCYRRNGSECILDDPEIILLFLIHTYNYVFYVASSDDYSKVSKVVNKYFSLGTNYGEDWMNYESIDCDADINSIYQLEKKDIEISEKSYYMLIGANAYLMTNAYQKREFPAPSFEIIIENTNYKGK